MGGPARGGPRRERRVLIAGCDPGLHGAIAWLDTETRAVQVGVMPLLPGVDGERDRYDVPRLREMLDRRRPAVVILERLHPLPAKFRRAGAEVGGGGVIANYNRGAATWLMIGLLTGLRIPFELVLPRVWQRALLENVPGEGTKAKSIWLARRLFPACSLLPTPRSRKPHDGCADALLLAELGRRQFAGDVGRQGGMLDVMGAAEAGGGPR